MTIYRDGKKVNEEGYLLPSNISGYATLANTSGYPTTVTANISTVVLSYTLLSSIQTMYEFSAASFDTVSGADWAAGATTTASSAIDVSAPSITAVAMVTGQGVGFSISVPPNANNVSQRIVARHYTSGPNATFTLYHRTIGGTWSGIITGNISGTLLYRNVLTSSAIASTIPISPGNANQFVLGVSCSGTVYLANYQLTFG